MKIYGIFAALALFASIPAFAEEMTCSGKDCLDWPVKGGNHLILNTDGVLQEVSCKGQGDRCSSTAQCCEGNECMVGDQSYATCGGG